MKTYESASFTSHVVLLSSEVAEQRTTSGLQRSRLCKRIIKTRLSSASHSWGSWWRSVSFIHTFKNVIAVVFMLKHSLIADHWGSLFKRKIQGQKKTNKWSTQWRERDAERESRKEGEMRDGWRATAGEKCKERRWRERQQERWIERRREMDGRREIQRERICAVWL